MGSKAKLWELFESLGSWRRRVAQDDELFLLVEQVFHQLNGTIESIDSIVQHTKLIQYESIVSVNDLVIKGGMDAI